MCGIAGQILTHSEGSDLLQRKESMQRALQKMHTRGPDHASCVEASGAVLGHNRLRILDLSDAADQPMRDDSGRYFLVFNGEIFNYKNLRAELEKSGIRFRTESDTEVLLHLLIQKGETALDLLNGFFAFCFYDSQEKKTIAAVDRYGEKPFWYCTKENRFSFASSLSALCQLESMNEIDRVSLHLLLQYSYIPGPNTILRGVQKLLPGNLVRISGGKSEFVRWHNSASVQAFKGSYEDARLELEHLLDDAVKIRLQADVPVGSFLSGGLDSSIISAVAARHKPAFRTFSVSFPDIPFLDEASFAKQVASAIGSSHETVEVRASEMADEVLHILQDADEPFADSSSIAVSILSARVKKNVTVALSGDGSDEIFGGYNKYRALLRSQAGCFTDKLISLSEPILDLLPAGRSNPLANTFRKLHKYNAGMKLTFRDRYLLWSSWSDEDICEKLLARDAILRIGARMNAYVQDVDASDFNSVLLADQSLVLANDMLVKVDSMSMRHALEVRAPFLDHRVVDFANSLPAQWKLDYYDGKKILTDTYRSQLPETILKRKKKGFEVPLEKWLREDLSSFVRDHLSSSLAAKDGHFSAITLSTILDDFYSRKNNRYTYVIYASLVFECWYRKFRSTSS